MKSEREEALSIGGTHVLPTSLGEGTWAFPRTACTAPAPSALQPFCAALQGFLGCPESWREPIRGSVTTSSTMAGYLSPAAHFYTEEQEYLQAYEDVLERYKGTVELKLCPRGNPGEGFTDCGAGDLELLLKIATGGCSGTGGRIGSRDVWLFQPAKWGRHLDSMVDSTQTRRGSKCPMSVALWCGSFLLEEASFFSFT